MKKQLVTISFLLFTVALLKAQNEADALRYSSLTYSGTARFTSMGGAFGALGGDISSLAFNPAGIAIYRKSELTFTPSLFNRTINSTYNHSTATDSKLNFNFSNIGLVATGKFGQDNEDGWVSFNLGIGYNRTNNFHSRTWIEGDNKKNSLLQAFTNAAQGLPSDQLDGFSTSLAWGAYLLDTVAGNPKTYYNPVPKGGVKQRKLIETSGAMAETDITFGANYSNRLYWGATIGIPYITYTETSTYEENDVKDTIHATGTLAGFKSFSMNQSLSTNSSYGVNFKFGVIYRVTDWIRIGGAVHTPSYFNLTDTYSTSITSNFDNGTGYTKESPSGNYDYNLTTPMRLMGSLAFIVGKKGLIGMDYEYLDYTTARLGATTPGVFLDANSAIRQKFTSTSNLRVGGELRLDPFAVRVGYALYGSPLSLYSEGKRSNYSIGFGYKNEGFFLDVAYVLTQSQEYYYLYDPSLVSSATNKIQSSAFMLTFGFRY